MKKLDTYPEKGKCPFCGSENLKYKDLEVTEAGVQYDATCKYCGGTFAECYDLVFAGHWELKDANGVEYEGLPT